MRRAGSRSLLVIGLLVTITVAVVVSQFASGDPDGLEYVAQETGILDTATDHGAASSPLADYGADLTDDGRLNTAAAGLLGVALTLSIGYGVFWVARRTRSNNAGHRPTR
jgi:hypothetical protein